MILIRPFQKDDIKAFEPLEPIEQDFFQDEKFVQAIEDSKLAVTGIKNGEIVGCGGVHPTDDPNMGVLWLRLSPKCQDFPLETARWLKCGIRIIEETFPFRQLNAVVKCGYEKGIRLVEKFGYKQVKIEDGYYIYSKLMGD